MIINKNLLDELTNQAKTNPRHRQAYDLSTTNDDNSQRMLNALAPRNYHAYPSSSEYLRDYGDGKRKINRALL